MATLFSNIGMVPMVATFTKPCCFSTNNNSSHVGKLSVSVKAAGGIKAEPPLNHLTNVISSSNSDIIRRSGNYEPTLWDFDFIQSLHNDYVGEEYMKRFEELKKEMKKMTNAVEGKEELPKLELIDNLQRLGVSYQFKDEIIQILKNIHEQRTCGDSLYATALKFRLFRQHGFTISQDIFNGFKDERGNFKQSLSKDIEGLLQLYEASFMTSIEPESTLELANKFATSHLKNYVKNQYGEEENATVALAKHALELPLHWMLSRAEARWYINFYEKMPNVNPLLLEFAKLDYNFIQATHQEDLKNLSRWWKNSCLAKKLPYARDRMTEAFFWVGGIMFEPQKNEFCRVLLAKVTAMATFIDDTYDVYGTYPELELFTAAVERMDIHAMDRLPDYMKILYLSLVNTINEIAYEVLKEQAGINAIPYLQKSWADLCKAYLLEAKWYYTGYKPTFQEYMDNAWVSVGAPVILVGAFFFATNPITKESLEAIRKYTDLIRWATTIVRLADDLATATDEMERGDVPSSIQCYMNEKNATEEEAREHIKNCINETWKLINKAQRENTILSEEYVEVVVNMARTGQSIYQYGDGHGIQNFEIKNRISDLYFEPIKIP